MERMGLEFISTKEHYHVKVVDKQGMVSKMSCKCTVQEDGKLAIDKAYGNVVRTFCWFQTIESSATVQI